MNQKTQKINQFQKIDTNHEDIIHDIAFDYYGKKLATCSTDRSVKIYQKSSNGEWKQINSITNQDGPVWKVKWAHPEFGNILAACSMDRYINIYEENRDFNQKDQSKKNNQKYNKYVYKINKDKQGTWRNTQIYDNESIEDMKFGPKHLGLILAIARADGIIRIFMFKDMLNLQIQEKITEINITKLGINSISWSKNRFDKPMIAIGCKDFNTSQIKHYCNVYGNTIKMPEEVEKSECFQIYAINIIANQQKLNQQIKIYPDETKQNEFLHSQAVNDVSWSLHNGKSFHLIGTCGKEGAIVWYLKNLEENQLQVLQKVILNYNLEVEVWKISWNLSGQLVSTTDSAEEMNVYQSKGIGQWQNVKTVKLYQDEIYF
ncbi:sec13, putative [Ichthyophthirius multifiliis]|uniref:Sec13, putative n=1 Tax=Ichthyophthirius multifiliis TaxID=5932 RepID=G0R4Q1_ICHMU|nr:sec13, putative [Ichthyophthirius multifiliis]EGR27557.1 sec13, putative [Ichthyophthirius multifiliis]|eukprot:XP_004025009.1 sec13, putative [Ichthyophthirius multifiliis]